MAKLILYQAKSPYQGDVTKNCALTGKEVDNNFLNLKGEDIDKIYLDEETKKLTFTRMKNGLKNCNGEIIDAQIEVDLTALEYVVGYEYDAGTIKILYSNGKTATMTPEAFGMAVATDSTIDGNGTLSKPLSIGQAYRTGHYQPVKGIIDASQGEELPKKDLRLGDGYVTKEIKSKFGLLYSSDEAIAVDGILKADNSEWRVPTKADWDKLLNCLEDCDSHKNHQLRSESEIDARGMNLGWVAGWKAKSIDTPETDFWTCGGTTNGGELRIYPTGYYGMNGNYTGFGDFAQFWSITVGDMSCRNFYTKRFTDLSGKVTQIEEMPATRLSIRLVKDFYGDNYYQFEDIHGKTYETKFFGCDEESGQIWTMANLDLNERGMGEPIPEDVTSAVTVETAYYINRWSGNAWERHELLEGESFVLLDEDDCSVMAEYRIECGELVDHNAILEGEIQQLREDLENEIEARENADNEIMSALTETAETLTERIDTEEAARQEGDDMLWSGLTETAATLSDAIADEVAARELLQDEVDEIENAVGLNEDGTFEPFDNSNYLNDAESVQEEIKTLDKFIGVASDVPENTSMTPAQLVQGGDYTLFQYINASSDFGYIIYPNGK